METALSPIRNIAMRFAEIIDEVGTRLHIGCVMAAGQDWVEVSLPEKMQLGNGLNVRFLPSQETHRVDARWRASDRVGFTYASGGPPEDQFAGLPGLLNPLPAALKISR